MSSPPTSSNPNLSDPLEVGLSPNKKKSIKNYTNKPQQHFSLLNHNILERLTRFARLAALVALLKRREMKTMGMADVDLVHRDLWEKEMRALVAKVQGLKPQSRYGG